MYISDVTKCIRISVIPEGAVRAGVRLLSSVISHVCPNLVAFSGLVVTDPTLEPGFISLNVGLVTLGRSQRQLTERALL